MDEGVLDSGRDLAARTITCDLCGKPNLVSVLMISSSDLGILMSIVLDGPHGARVYPMGYTN